ncbi:TAXI family TRAP transporter solute-binding subunit [Sporosarcina sp. ACRSL]|uniref:TAXI family TRAP transporter solute-binding subunit n=1 Tax=Sporosarcina sp. ACRSL TaxID=2918215 RepID=UPI001EF67DCB|nr:TAXI family TRAP transporter solute-binding subunit [Sporosarcina sp. ACRSL]MCG7345514.1 TAXI family TRAP transporter solute-binding subunit [Sporosarcina sp. ACRSL]
MKKKLTLVSGIALALMLAACNSDGKTETSKETDATGLDTNIVTIATGGASGPYNIIATTLADKYTSLYDVNSRTQTTGASVENINLMEQGKVEMAFVMSDALSQAINGEVSFSAPAKNVSQIATLYPNVVQIIAKKGSGIETIEDLKGKRVAVGDQNSGVEINARNLLNGHGITYDDLKVDYLGYAEASDGLSAGTIDAAFLTSGLPNASVLELSETVGVDLVTITPENVEEIAKDHPYFISYEIPAGTYGNEEALMTAAVPNALIVRTDMSDDDVYNLTKAFFENLPTLQNSHQAAKEITLELAQESLIAPLHPGAKRYYDEQKK